MSVFPRRQITGMLRHAALTLVLNFRAPQPLVYGFLVPLLFLLAFGAVFRGETPVLRNEMAQLLTISILGGACFGLPTALVAERERGVWKLHRLLPVGTGWLLAGTLLARIVLVWAAGALQLVVAHLLYGTPWPQNPALFVAAYGCACLAFLGLGLLIAAWARGVPSVQAIGQCLFLPMLMIGGVGIPLTLLPDWAQLISGFMPGRYAVNLLHEACVDAHGLAPIAFDALALLAIAASSLTAGLVLFRCDAETPRPRTAGRWTALAAAIWLGVGAMAANTGRVAPEAALERGLDEVPATLVASIRYDDLPSDSGLVTQLSPPFGMDGRPPLIDLFARRLDAWEPAREGPELSRIRRLLSVASIADVSQDPREAGIARVVFDKLIRDHGRARLERALTWIILRPDDEQPPRTIPELGLHREITPEAIRQRNSLYARKLLGRLTGAIPETPRNEAQVPR